MRSTHTFAILNLTVEYVLENVQVLSVPGSWRRVILKHGVNKFQGFINRPLRPIALKVKGKKQLAYLNLYTGNKEPQPPADIR